MSAMSAGLVGAVLVGGRSVRMGRSKARLCLAGQELWRRQVEVLAAAGARPVRLVLRRRQRSFGWDGGELRDAADGVGPLAGLTAALEQDSASWVAVLAVDLPRITPGWFRRLRRHCAPGRGAVVLGPEGYEPLAAIYPREALAACVRRLRQGRYALQGLVRELAQNGRLTVVLLTARWAGEVENWNRPADVRRRGVKASASRRAWP